MKMLKAIFVVAVCIGISAPAKAQEKSPPISVAQKSDKALELASGGKFREAIVLWLDLLDEMSPEAALDIHVNLAVAYKRLNRMPEAWYHLATYLKTSTKEDKAAGTELQRIEDALQTSHVKMAVTCEPAGTAIRFSAMSDAVRYPCPITWWFVPGKNEIQASREGYVSSSTPFDVRKRGGDALVSVVLKQDVRGVLLIEGKGRAIQVFINGELEGKVPFKRKMKPGTYQLMVGAPGKMPWKKSVTITAGETAVEKPPMAQPKAIVKAPEKTPTGTPVTVTARPQATRSDSGWWKWTVLGSGVALIAVGAGVQVAGFGKDRDLRDQYPADQGLPEAQFVANAQAYKDAFADEVKPLRTTSYVLYGVGAAATVAGAILLLWPEKAENKGSLTLLPAPGNNGFGFTFEMGF